VRNHSKIDHGDGSPAKGKTAAQFQVIKSVFAEESSQMIDDTRSRQALLNEILTLRGRVAEIEAREAVPDTSETNTVVEGRQRIGRRISCCGADGTQGICVARDG
jgi:hypothetical protein